jgi:hypothetical protein
MKPNEFREFCRLDENMWQKFMSDEQSEGPPQKKWKRREKMARADLIIQQKREEGLGKRKIVTAIVGATGVSRKTACQWLNHWIKQHEPEVALDKQPDEDEDEDEDEVGIDANKFTAFVNRKDGTGI